ncbi:MAG: hypothetical protein H5T64_07575 [Chloroflexi bacterium]|nr:hypothetical protein [Chloroflexota bacterium]
MQKFDLAFAWTWEYDAAFATFLEVACQKRGLSIYQVRPDNLGLVMEALKAGELGFHCFFDRSSDADPAFLPLVAWAASHIPHRFNDFPFARRAWDKVNMHTAFLAAGLHTPYTIILPPFVHAPALPEPDLSPLGETFVIKPAHGGGGVGVLTEAHTWAEVLAARMLFPEDAYLVQTRITPVLLEGQPAWFRVIHVVDNAHPCWWNQQTHIYREVTEEEEYRLGLGPLRVMTEVIARICQLDLFSTEIACTRDGHFLAVDYVNDPIDLRPQSLAVEGVPDSLVAQIAARVADWVSIRIG